MTRAILTAIAFALIVMPGAASAKRARKSSLPTLVKSYQRMSPAKVLSGLRGLSNNDHLTLSVYGALASDMFYRACHADASISMGITGTIVTCQSAHMQRLNTLQFITPQSLQQNIESERQTFLIGHRCSTGKLSRRSCGAYFGTASRMSAMRHDTNMRIIEAIGNQCRVGVDPGCHH